MGGGNRNSNRVADGDQDESVLRLRWNSHVESLQQLFESLLEQQLFVDVTLACEGGSLRAHRVMLSACSAYFRRVLNEHQSKNPVIIMRDVSSSEMDFILQFIYRGEIHVPEARLSSLLKTARLLEIRGLSDNLEKPATEATASDDAADETDGHHGLPLSGQAKQQANSFPITEANTSNTSSSSSSSNSSVGGGSIRKRRSSGVNGFAASSPDSVTNLTNGHGKAKRVAQTKKEEGREEAELADRLVDNNVSARAKITNGNHCSAGKVSCSSTSSAADSLRHSPLDLSGGASDEENEMPVATPEKGHSADEQQSIRVVKCESSTPDQAVADEEDDDEDDEEDDASSAATEEQSTGSGGVAVQAVCPFCFKDCKRTAELRAHIRAHTGEKPFRCDICSAPFARSAHLKRHRRVHTGERPFECHRCQKTFSRQDKLKLHMDRHRLRDTGGKTVVGRPKKTVAGRSKVANNDAAAAAGNDAATTPTASTASSSTPTPNSTSDMMTGMGQFAFPGAPARPAQSPTPFGDLNYFSLLSLSQRGLTISSASGSQSHHHDLPSPTVPHLLSPQALQELQLFRSSSSPRGRPPNHQRAARASQRANGRSSVESASETLLNFAQQVGEVGSSPATSQL